MTNHRRFLISKEHKDLAVSAIAVLASAVTVITCSAVGPKKQHEQTAAHESSAQSQPAVSSVASSVTPDADPSLSNAGSRKPDAGTELWAGRWIAPDDLGTTEEGNKVPGLPRFYDSLARLESGRLDSHVRVVWIGDSHTQADGWTHAVRTTLQTRFGNGGPGFVHIGWTTFGYRRDGVVLRSMGPWSLLPASLVSVTRVGDGVVGLGGVRVEGRGIDALASVGVDAKDLAGKGLWNLAVRFVESDSSLVVSIDGTVHRLEAEQHTLGHIRHVEFESKGPGGTLQVEQPFNRPQLLGVVVEAKDRYGVVLDTLGLNGARYRSALAWDEATWVAELARREPDLVVVAFGSNESSDSPAPKYENHQDHVKQLMARVRKAAPQADCLVFGPIDRGGRYEEIVSRLNEAQAAAAAEVGCAFWSGQVAMGGPGSMYAWGRQVPQLGSRDALHLTMRGYKVLGEMLGRDLLRGYDAGVVRVD